MKFMYKDEVCKYDWVIFLRTIRGRMCQIVDEVGMQKVGVET